MQGVGVACAIRPVTHLDNFADGSSSNEIQVGFLTARNREYFSKYNTFRGRYCVFI